MSLVASGRFPILAARLFRGATLVTGLTLIGFLVGVGCAILPLAAPLGIVAVLGLFLLWVMPDRHVVTGRYQRWITLVFIFSIVSIPSYYTLFFPGLPWISLRRAILLAFTASTLLTFATSKEDRHQLVSTLRSSKLPTFLLMTLAGLWGLSIIGSNLPAITIAILLNQNLVWIACASAIIITCHTRNAIKYTLLSITIFSFIDFLIGGTEFFLKRPFLFYAVPENIREQLIAVNLNLASLLQGSGFRNGLYRASSVFTGPLSWGEMAALTAPLAAYFATESRSAWGRIYGSGVVVTCFLSIYFSGSRGAYVGFLAAMTVYAMLWTVRYRRRHPGNLAGGIFSVMFLIGAVGLIGSVFFVDRINKTVLGNNQTQASTEARSAQWQLAKPYVISRPVIGYGVGQAGRIVNYTVTPGAGVTLDSYVIALLVELGIPGLVAYMGFFICLIASCAYAFVFQDRQGSNMGAGLACSMIAYSIYRLTLAQIDNNYLAFAIAGASLRLLHLVRSEKLTLSQMPDPEHARHLSGATTRNATSEA